jgi:hypothetical protein
MKPPQGKFSLSFLEILLFSMAQDEKPFFEGRRYWGWGGRKRGSNLSSFFFSLELLSK